MPAAKKPMPLPRIPSGIKAQQGESLAEYELKKQGFKILEKNWTSFLGEVDLIARDVGGCLVFIEVKSRWNDEESAWDSLGPKKQEKLRHLALAYLKSKNLPLETALRFDVVIVDLKTQKAHHHPEAFEPSVEI